MTKKTEGFRTIQEILDRSKVMRRLREYGRQEDIQHVWEEVVGANFAKHTRALRYHGGQLFVQVFAAPLLLELSSFRKAELLGKIREFEGFERISNIVFKQR